MPMFPVRITSSGVTTIPPLGISIHKITKPSSSIGAEKALWLSVLHHLSAHSDHPDGYNLLFSDTHLILSSSFSIAGVFFSRKDNTLPLSL